MKATFKAIANYGTAAPVLAPVGTSGLAQRRGRDRPKSSTEV